MCGICGIVGSRDINLIRRMMESLHHRGPDEDGVWLGDNIALGIKRLAIIDPETGQQPVFNEDRTVVAVMNGEIYNHAFLRNLLEERGHHFQSHHSDTEVIVHLYEEFGMDFPTHLNGMFAIGLWDANNKSLILVRDHVGIKPLYFSIYQNNLIFGSEPKAVLSHPDVSRSPNFSALHHYFTLKNIPAPMSAFRDLEQLRPGELAIFRNSSLTRHQWWKPKCGGEITISEREASDEIGRLLRDSVSLQMQSDVPIAAYLSGGIDSSSVVALMSEQSSEPVKTFTLIYHDIHSNKRADQEAANRIAEIYKTDHHECLVTYHDLPQRLDSILDAFDEPFSGVISTYFLTEEIGKHVKVALSGDGADELFGSYLPHRLAQPLAAYSRLTNDFRFLSKRQLDQLASHEEDIQVLDRIASLGDESAQRMGLYISNDDRNKSLYSDYMLAETNHASTESVIRDILNGCQSNDPLNRFLYLDHQTLLPDQVLPFVDRLSMAHSVEVRPPFLDPRLVEFSYKLPGDLKIQKGRVKHILKEAVRPLLPPDLIDRPKEGFLMPINEWIISNLGTYVQSILSPARIGKHGLFRSDAIRSLIDNHYSGAINHGNRIWNLMMFQLWWEKYCD